MDILQKLYDSEINFSISTFWDGGFEAKLGDVINGFSHHGSFESMNGAIIALTAWALIEYPNSKFSKEIKSN